MSLPKLSFSTLACPDWSWKQLLEAAREYHYDGVEIRFLAGDTDLLEADVFRPENHERTLTDLHQSGISIAAIASSVHFDDLDPKKLAHELQTGRAYIELCQHLGIHVLRVFGDAFPEPGLREQIIHQVTESLQSLGEFAENRDVQVVLETHGDFSDSKNIAAVFNNIRSPSVGILWDTHHPWRYLGEHPVSTFDLIGHWVQHTHWKDSVTIPQKEAVPESSEAAATAHQLMSGHRHANYVLFGEGEFPAFDVHRLLIDNHYTGWYSLEWEKAWHPELDAPEIALPQFSQQMRTLLTKE